MNYCDGDEWADEREREGGMEEGSGRGEEGAREDDVMRRMKTVCVRVCVWRGICGLSLALPESYVVVLRVHPFVDFSA